MVFSSLVIRSAPALLHCNRQAISLARAAVGDLGAATGELIALVRPGQPGVEHSAPATRPSVGILTAFEPSRGHRSVGPPGGWGQSWDFVPPARDARAALGR